MLKYYDTIKTPLGSKSNLKLNNKSDWFIQTPPGHISIINNKLIFRINYNKHDYTIFLNKLNEINKEWKDIHFPNGKQKIIKMCPEHIEVKITDNTEVFDKYNNIGYIKDIYDKQLMLLITTPNIWISKKQYGNTWQILQIKYA